MMSLLFPLLQHTIVVSVLPSVWSVQTLRTAMFAREMLYKITQEQEISAHALASTTTRISPTSTIVKVSYNYC